MPQLTAQQRWFLETYVTYGPLSFRGLDLAVGLERPAAPLAARAQAVRDQLPAIAAPPQANPGELAAMDTLRRQIIDGLADPLERASLFVAETDLDALKLLRTQVLARIQADALARAESGRLLRAQIAETKAEHADPTAAAQIATLAAALTEGWQDPPTDEQLKHAEDGLPALQEAVRKESEARDARQATRALLLKELGDLAAAGADDGEAASIEELKSKGRLALPEFPGIQPLADGQIAMAALRGGVMQANQAIAARAARRDEIVTLRNATLSAGWLAAERDEVVQAVAAFPSLEGAISAATLALAEAEVLKLAKIKADVALLISARKAQAARVAEALSQAVWGAGQLIAPAGAPAAMVEAQQNKLEKLRSDNAAFAQADAPDTWPLKEAGAIAGRAEAVIAEVAALAKALEEIRLAVEKVTQAEAATRSQIAATAMHTLSGGQQSALADRIAAAKGKFTSQLAEADAAVVALTEIADAAKHLQRELRALALRIAAVNLVPPGASAADRKVLAELKKLASDAIEKVDP